MASEKIQLQVITPDRKFFEGDVGMIVLRTTEGYMGVLHDHEPLVTTIDIGVLRIKEGTEEKKASLMGGFAEIHPERITILTDAAEWPHEIDVKRAESAKQRAEERLQKKSSDINLLRAEMALKKSLVRLEVSNQNYK
jgi:F-type H+-transporting ATPase subunit epsilon